MAAHPGEYWASAEVTERFMKTKLCLAESTSSPCDSPIIRAHTIPRAQMRRIAVNGHVYAIHPSAGNMMKNKGKFVAELLGINEFSVLYCFCRKSDNDIFSDLEDHPLHIFPSTDRSFALSSDWCRAL